MEAHLKWMVVGISAIQEFNDEGTIDRQELCQRDSGKKFLGM